MQVERLPSWVHNELDKSMRRYGWGNAEGRRGVHLVDWDSLCKPKDMGGANLKSTKDMNRALMEKLA